MPVVLDRILTLLTADSRPAVLLAMAGILVTALLLYRRQALTRSGLALIVVIIVVIGSWFTLSLG